MKNEQSMKAMEGNSFILPVENIKKKKSKTKVTIPIQYSVSFWKYKSISCQIIMSAPLNKILSHSKLLFV